MDGSGRRRFLKVLAIGGGACAGVFGGEAAEIAGPPGTAPRLPGGDGTAAPGAPCSKLHIQITDESGQPVWVRLEVRGRNEKMFQPANGLRDLTAHPHSGMPYYLGSFIVHGECWVSVPPGNYLVIAEHGLEFEREERSVDVRENATSQVGIQMRRWILMRDLGWWSADMHVHRLPKDTRILVQAEDLNLCPVITMWPHGIRGYPALDGGQEMPPSAHFTVDSTHIVTLRNAEDERQGGAWIYQGLQKYLTGLKQAAWQSPTALPFIKEALDQRPSHHRLPWIDYEDPIWWQVPAMMPLAPADSIEILNNHFMQYGFDANASWGRPYNRKEYRGMWGFTEYCLGLYYRYLNLGFRFPASAGSASGVHPNPLGYNRVYVHLDRQFSVQNWYQALKQGKSFVTNGPMLFFRARREGPLLEVFVEAHAREPIDRIEIIANGQTIRWFPVLGKKDFAAHLGVPVRGFSWIAARCFLETGFTVRLAHTSPVYLSEKWDGGEAAHFFAKWVQDLIQQVSASAKPHHQDREQSLDVFRRALRYYQNWKPS